MRDATDYYNLLNDTLKNGRNQIKYIYDKLDNAIEKDKFINIRTGCLIKEKDCNNYNYYFHYDNEYPLCYKFPCCGLARDRVIKKIIDFYIRCLKEYHRTKDEEKMKLLIDDEIESAKKNYEHLNKNNHGFDDLKLFNIPPHNNEPQENEESFNSSSFINDNNSNNQNNSFINDNEIEENENEDNEENSGLEGKNRKKKGTLIKNGKKVVNIYKKELDDLLEENYDGEEDLKKEENEESENNFDLDLGTKYSSSKKKKLCKNNLLNKKLKRNIINDSDEENEHENEEEKEKDENNNDENISEKQNQNLSQEIKNLIKKDEEEDQYNNEIINNKEIKSKKKKEPINYEYYKGLKENFKLKQGTLDAFLNIK